MTVLERPIPYLHYGFVTLVMLLFVFAAFDDITTDNATSFRAEYSILVISAAWLTVLSARLMLGRHLVLGITSTFALVGALWGQRAIGPEMTPGFRPEYVVTTAAYLWFVTLSGLLLWQGWRRHPEQEPARPR